MAARRPFWKWHRWKSIGFCLWPPSTCIWNLKLKFQSKLDLCSGNHVVYRQTDGRTDRRTDGRTRWIQYTPPPTSLGGGIITLQFIPKGSIYNIPVLVQVKARRLPGDTPLSEPMMFSLLTHMCVNGHQWVMIHIPLTKGPVMES